MKLADKEGEIPVVGINSEVILASRRVELLGIEVQIGR
jgi:hypothetical protein